MNQKVNEWIEAHTQDLIEDIKELCAIPSVKGEPQEGMPFGEGPYRSLNKAMELAAGYGFATKNYDNYVATADFDPALPHTLDMLAHTDVVPAGEGWTVTEPFTVIEKDGALYGRGTADDKGPMLCALYAMRALKETGIPVKKGIRMIMGADEECGSSDIAKYYAVEEEAPMTFSPDADFPIINIEKGQYRGTLKKSYAEDKGTPRILSLDAGIAVNAVPQKAVVKFEGLDLTSDEVKAAIAEVEQVCGVHIEVTGEQEVTVIGQSAHAASPQTGKNAGLAAVMLADRLPLHESEQVTLLRKIPELFPYGVTDGSGIGIRMCDEESHDLTCTLDLYHSDPQGCSFTFDARTPVMATKENCEDASRAAAEAAGFDFETPGMIPPHVVPGDGEFVQTLLGAYEDVTGEKGECLAIGGGTYVHDLKNGVAFGATFPGVDPHMHGADEFFSIHDIVLSTKIYAEALIRLCC